MGRAFNEANVCICFYNCFRTQTAIVHGTCIQCISLKPRLSIPVFISQLWYRDTEIQNRKPGFEANTTYTLWDIMLKPYWSYHSCRHWQLPCRGNNQCSNTSDNWTLVHGENICSHGGTEHWELKLTYIYCAVRTHKILYITPSTNHWRSWL